MELLQVYLLPPFYKGGYIIPKDMLFTKLQGYILNAFVGQEKGN